MFNRFFGEDEGVGESTQPVSEPSSEPDADEDTASIRRAISELGSLPVERRRFLAGYAYVLVRVARADAEVNDAEIERMERSIIAAGGLPEALGALLVVLASRLHSLYGASEDYTCLLYTSDAADEYQRV